MSVCPSVLLTVQRLKNVTMQVSAKPSLALPTNPATVVLHSSRHSLSPTKCPLICLLAKKSMSVMAKLSSTSTTRRVPSTCPPPTAKIPLLSRFTRMISILACLICLPSFSVKHSLCKSILLSAVKSLQWQKPICLPIWTATQARQICLSTVSSRLLNL